MTPIDLNIDTVLMPGLGDQIAALFVEFAPLLMLLIGLYIAFIAIRLLLRLFIDAYSGILDRVNK